jgi:hypothetical protein
MTLLDRLSRRRNGAQELDMIEPAPTTSGTMCPHCGEAVKLNELVRSAHHVLGCRYCYK